MQAKPTHPTPRFLVLELAIHAIEVLRPIVARVRECDRDLGEQLQRALSSVALNVAEGNRSQGGHRLARFSTAAGSNSESRAELALPMRKRMNFLRVRYPWGGSSL
jgi:four helix bundle protein